MRTIKDIQTDIQIISRKKPTFFTRIFNSDENKLKELLKEEFICLDQFLLENDLEYKNLAQKNIQLLDNLTWEFKVLDIARDGEKPFQVFTAELNGEIDINGHAYCERVTDTNLFQKFPSKLIGHINHLGKISIQATDLETYKFQFPKSFTANITKDGDFTFEKKEEEFSTRQDRQVQTIGGDPFMGSENKRKEFLKTRLKLYEIIKQNRILKTN